MSTSGGRIAANRQRQGELYGVPWGERVHRLTATLGITQARLARVLGVSPAMLSQLVSGRRIKIGDPAVLARLLLLDRRVAARTRFPPRVVEALLEDVAAARLHWTPPGPAAGRTLAHPLPAATAPGAVTAAAGALRAVVAPARLAGAAAAVAAAYPEVAEVLRQAAGDAVACAAGA